MNKRLYRVRDGKLLMGVCAGVAEYFSLDPTVIRLGWILFSCLGGFGILAYVAAAIIMPEKPLELR